jgi:hypothetical protein
LNPYYAAYYPSTAPYAVEYIQFNFITATKRLVGDASGYVMDAIGNQSNSNSGTFVNPDYIPVTSSGHYTDQSLGPPEEAGDTYGGSYPPIDMTGWSVTVDGPGP